MVLQFFELCTYTNINWCKYVTKGLFLQVCIWMHRKDSSTLQNAWTNELNWSISVRCANLICKNRKNAMNKKWNFDTWQLRKKRFILSVSLAQQKCSRQQMIAHITICNQLRAAWSFTQFHSKTCEAIVVLPQVFVFHFCIASTVLFVMFWTVMCEISVSPEVPLWVFLSTSMLLELLNVLLAFSNKLFMPSTHLVVVDPVRSKMLPWNHTGMYDNLPEGLPQWNMRQAVAGRIFGWHKSWRMQTECSLFQSPTQWIP